MPESPYLLVDPERVRENYRALDAALLRAGRRARIRFAVKACPVPQVVRVLDAEGAQFDVASVGGGGEGGEGGGQPGRAA
ncbi:hypothetical protein [Nocardia cyriacigeorgica]|uniref:hypothetical protein n=1 Tax=Nocardia cyriacigeorgica TaxID=135487 RepID=UPI0024575743|nr:hypothetical protein [Nocardia cyriacigeorgica]